jgi:hypothetical protein
MRIRAVFGTFIISWTVLGEYVYCFVKKECVEMQLKKDSSTRKVTALTDEQIQRIAGGTYEETLELANWCNAHGANIQIVGIDDPAYQIMERDTALYVMNYSDLYIDGFFFDTFAPDRYEPNRAIVGNTASPMRPRNHQELMDFLNTYYK